MHYGKVAVVVIKPFLGMANDNHAFDVRLREPPETKGESKLRMAVCDHPTEDVNRKPHSIVLVNP